VLALLGNLLARCANLLFQLCLLPKLLPDALCFLFFFLLLDLVFMRKPEFIQLTNESALRGTYYY
jgi:hypothetical protein